MIHGRVKPAGKAWSDNAPWHKRSRLRETFSAEFDGAGSEQEEFWNNS